MKRSEELARTPSHTSISSSSSIKRNKRNSSFLLRGGGARAVRSPFTMAARLLTKILGDPDLKKAVEQKRQRGLTNVPEGVFRFRVTMHHGVPAHVSSMGWDPVQRTLALGTSDGQLKTWGKPGVEWLLQEPTGKRIKRLIPLSNEARILAIDEENVIQEYDLVRGEMSRHMELRRVITCIFLPVGQSFLFLGTQDGRVIVFNTQTFILTSHEILPLHTGFESPNDVPPVSCLELCPTDESQLLIGYQDGHMVVWDLRARKVAKRFKHTHEDLHTATWCCTGKSIACGYGNGDVFVLQEGKTTKILSGDSVNRLSVMKIVWSGAQHNTLFVSGGTIQGAEPEGVQVLQGAKWDRRFVISQGTDASVADFVLVRASPYPAVAEDATAIITLSRKGNIAVHDLTRLGQASLLLQPFQRSPIRCMESCNGCKAFLDDLHRVRVALGLRPWRSEWPPAPFRAWPITGGILIPSNEAPKPCVLFTGHGNGCVHIWDASGPPLFHITTIDLHVLHRPPKNAAVSRIAFERESRLLAIGCESGEVLMFTFSTIHRAVEVLPFDLGIKNLDEEPPPPPPPITTTEDFLKTQENENNEEKGDSTSAVAAAEVVTTPPPPVQEESERPASASSQRRVDDDKEKEESPNVCCGEIATSPLQPPGFQLTIHSAESTDPIKSLVIASGVNRLAAANAAGRMIIIDILSGNCMYKRSVVKGQAVTSLCSTVAPIPGSDSHAPLSTPMLLAGHVDGSIAIFDFLSCQCLTTIHPKHSSAPVASLLVLDVLGRQISGMATEWTDPEEPSGVEGPDDWEDVAPEVIRVESEELQRSSVPARDSLSSGACTPAEGEGQAEESNSGEQARPGSSSNGPEVLEKTSSLSIVESQFVRYVLSCTEDAIRLYRLPTLVVTKKIRSAKPLLGARIISMEDDMNVVAVFISDGTVQVFRFPELSLITTENITIKGNLFSPFSSRQFVCESDGRLIFHIHNNELARASLLISENALNLPDSYPKPFIPNLLMPEPPKRGMFGGFFGGPKAVDHEELFAECDDTPTEKGSERTEKAKADVSSAVDAVHKAHEALVDRGEKISHLQERTSRMRDEAENFYMTAKHLREAAERKAGIL